MHKSCSLFFRKVVSSALAAAITLCGAVPVCSSGSTDAYDDIEAQINEVAVLVNEARIEHGLEPLYLVPVLCEVSEVRSQELVQCFDHNRPTGELFDTALYSFGIETGAAAENIAAGSYYAEDTFEQWVNSPDHWDNILSEAYTHTGIAVYYAEDDIFHWYWDQIFINSSETFEGQTLPQRVKAVPISYGDIDCDNTVSVFDLILLLNALSKQVTLNELQLESADCMLDGALTIADAVVLKKYLFGKYKTLPIEP